MTSLPKLAGVCTGVGFGAAGVGFIFRKFSSTVEAESRRDSLESQLKIASGGKEELERRPSSVEKAEELERLHGRLH